MKTLLIDNGSTLTQKLADLVPTDTDIHEYSEIPRDVSGYSMIILSGSSQFPVSGNEAILSNEIELVRNVSVPVIGVCLGHEIIGHAFGGKVEPLGEQHVGMVNINVVQPHKMFGSMTEFDVYENHQYGLTTVPDTFHPLAKSDHAVAIMKHKEKAIYGFQFHPEHHVEDQLGDEIFLSLFNELTSGLQ